MRVIHIVPGSGGTFYCENCFRDNALVQALRRTGHDVVLVPLYLPLFLDQPLTDSHAPVFFGAVSLYLREAFPVLRRLPPRLLRALDTPPILAWAARRAGSTRAAGLADMTLSMLQGAAGRQAEELDQLVSWLQAERRPTVVHLSNALLLGLARRLRRDVGARVVCTLQDEDTWVDAMPAATAQRIWGAMRACVPDVDAFVAVSGYYAERMRSQLALPADKLRVVHIGIDLEGYAPPSPDPGAPPVLGYLSRLTPGLGLETLVDAFIALQREPELGALRLRATGGVVGQDRAFLRRLDRRLAQAGLTDSVEWLPDFNRAARQAFLRTLTALSVPVPGGEAFGTYILEAQASGVPVVQPAVAAFPEILNATQGGVLYDPSQPGALADALRPLLRNPTAARTLGLRGREAVLARFGVDRMAGDLLKLYAELETSEQRKGV